MVFYYKYFSLFLSFTGFQVFSYADLNCGYIHDTLKNLLYASLCWTVDLVFYFKMNTVLIVSFSFYFQLLSGVMCIDNVDSRIVRNSFPVKIIFENFHCQD